MTLANMTQQETNDHNRATCKNIADNLGYIAYGQLYRCEYCGEQFDVEQHSDNDDVYYPIVDGDECECPYCHNETTFHQIDIYDWLENALDWDYTISRNGDYRACRIMVAFGGPTIYVDTLSAEVKLFWWADRASYPLSNNVCALVDEYMEDYFLSTL